MTLPAAALAEADLTDLARRAAAGDESAFTRLVEASSPLLYALALRLVGNEHDARDVLQEAYLRAYRSIGGFREDAAVTTWLYRITANCASTHLRRRRRHTEPLGEQAERADVAAALAFEAVDASGDDRRRLTAAIDGLAPGLRAVVVLHDIYGFSHDALCEELHISKAASKVRLHRARRRLRELLTTGAPRPAGRSDAPRRIGEAARGEAARPTLALVEEATP